MSTTPDQKAMILDLWREVRERVGDESVDVKSRIAWNWPSLSSNEVAEVWSAYQRRMKMKRKKIVEVKAGRAESVSSPSRPPKHHIRCELGHRLYTEVFTSTRAAKVFLDMLLKNEPIKWESSEILTAKGGVLRVQCEELEDIMEFEAGDEWQMPENMKDQLKAFLRGHWENKPKDVALPPPKPVVRGRVRGETKHRSAADGMVTLASMCEKHKWEPRNVRAALRKANWDKPDGGWLWPEKQAGAVEKKLEGLMK